MDNVERLIVELNQKMDKLTADVNGKIERLETGHKNLEHLILDVKESLERDIAKLTDHVQAINTRMDVQSARLDRQAGTLQAGTRWIARINQWTERIDRSIEKHDRELSDMRPRLKFPEQPNN